jgi:GNAT superfamily N-acetyltransferase
MANPFAKFAQPEVEQNPFAQFAQPQEETAAPKIPNQPQETTSNPLIGLVGRTASLTGAFVDSVAEVAERVGDKLELAMPLSGIPAEDIKNKKQLQPLFDWAKSLKDYGEGLGYQPSTQLKELGSNPLNTIPFVAERVITSVPDMVSAVRVPVAYVMARTKEILDERVKNDEKTLDDATVADVTAAATAAVIESTLERFATKGLFKPTTAKTATGRIAKETGIQAGTEVAEEEAAYLGEAAGTKKGLSAEEALTRGAEAAIVGGGLGFGVQGTKELFTPTTPPTTSEEQRQTILDSLAQGEEEPAGMFADQEGDQPAGEQSQVGIYAQRAADALESTNAVVGRGSTVSSKYGDADQTLPPSDEPPGLFEDVDTGAAAAATPSAPAAPAAPASAQTIEAYGDFVRQYTDLRDEYNSLPMGRIDQAGMNQRGLILKDLAQVVDANMGLIRSRGLAQQLKNPMFDGSKVLTRLEPNVGQPRAMQGNLFGVFQAATRRMKNAMALSGQSVDGAIAELEDNRARIQEKIDSGGFDDATIISMRPAGMSSGQALKSRDSIVQNFSQRSNAEIDQAIDMLRRGVGQPRAMQGSLTPEQMQLRLKRTNLTAKAEDAQARADEEQAKVDNLKEKIANGTPVRPGLLDTLTEQASWLQGEANKAKAALNQVNEQLQKLGQPRAMQSKLFGQPEGTPDVGTDKPEDIEDVFNAANADELNKSRMRASEKSKEIEAANKGRTQQAGASMTASERVGLFKSERKRVERELEKARVELDRLRAAAARPAGEIGYRPTSEDIREVSDTINGYERTLQGVREQLQEAEADLDSGIEAPTPRQRQEVQRVELTGEQEKLFDTEAFDANATEVTERKVAPIVDERGAIVPSPKEGEDPIASAGFKTLDEDNNISDNLVGATFITGMDVSARNKGAGTRLLNAITNWADTNGKTLVLVPSANPDPELGGLSQKQLKAWYARNGFEDRVDYMVRVPTEERVQETEETKPAETVRQGVPPKERFEKAPEVDTEHVVQTEEGGKIKDFFGSIQSSSDSPAEQERHGNSKNTAADTMLEFDIAQPGETTSAGSKQMLDYLARRVGGLDKFNKLLTALKNASPDAQSRLLTNAGLPDLTTRRGMDEFSSQVQEYVDQMLATGEGPLFNIRTSKMRPSKVTGTNLPYQEDDYHHRYSYTSF